MDYSVAVEKRDINKIDKLNGIVDLAGYWDQVRRLTKDVKSDHGMHRWQCLAELRFNELKDMYIEGYNKMYALLLSEIGEANMDQVMNWINGMGELPKSMPDRSISHAHTLRMFHRQCKYLK